MDVLVGRDTWSLIANSKLCNEILKPLLFIARKNFVARKDSNLYKKELYCKRILWSL
jgi:hypothetical protein